LILVDTSVWVDHFRRRNAKLSQLLEDGAVYTHPMVLGELACGNLRERTRTIALLALLPSVPQVTDEVVLQAIELRRLWGQGIGWVDAHLLCAALISRCPLWTLDRRLSRLAEQALE
jgi:predicted nucleic acid-binding protein